MIDVSGTPHTFWREGEHTKINILNKAHMLVNNDKTPHELWFGKTPIVKHFRDFGSKCYIKNNDDNIGNTTRKRDIGEGRKMSP